MSLKIENLRRCRIASGLYGPLNLRTETCSNDHACTFAGITKNNLHAVSLVSSWSRFEITQLVSCDGGLGHIQRKKFFEHWA